MATFSYTKIFFVVLFAVLVANISAGVFFKYWIAYEAEVAFEQASTELKRASEERKRKLEIQQLRAKERLAQEKARKELQVIQQRRSQERKSNARRINREVCQYWTKAYSENRSRYNDSMRDKACNRTR
jgi:hypothetical protein